MLRILYTLVTIFAITLSAFCQSPVTLPDSTIKALQKGIDGFKNRYHSPSLVLALVHKNEIIFSQALGYLDIEQKIPASIDAQYSIQSLTKVFTATMFMQLTEQTKVKLDDQVKKYVPELMIKSAGAEKQGITLLQLATHTAGLPRNSPADIQFTKQIDRWILAGLPEKVIEAATKKEFLHSLASIIKEYPDYQQLNYGNRHYSNLGYSLLGIALERAAKVDYADYIIKHICQPLKMTNSIFYDQTPMARNVAKGYFYQATTNDYRQVPIFKPNSSLPAGGLYTSARDLANFINFQFQSDSTSANAVLSEKNRAMMQAFNIGWKPAYPYVLHEGAMLGYRSEMVLHPGLKFGWVILTNTTDFDFSRINEYISRLLLPIFTTKPVTDLAKFTGTYRLSGGYDNLRIWSKEGRLYSSYLAGILPESPLEATGPHYFKGPSQGGYSLSYEFIPDKNGEITVLNMGQLMWIKP
jgi:CubicO group peptidase (beta-lactamase class C family)